MCVVQVLTVGIVACYIVCVVYGAFKAEQETFVLGMGQIMKTFSMRLASK